MDTGRAGRSVSWRQAVWETWKNYLDTDKKLFDTVLYAIGQSLSIDLKKNGITGQ